MGVTCSNRRQKGITHDSNAAIGTPSRSKLTYSLSSAPQTTRLFELLWRFAADRQRVFRARLSGNYDPSGVDPVIRKYKFTNAYRASDRTSQYLIRNVIYDGQDRAFRDEFARILLFKVFNKIETWQSLERRCGQLNADAICDWQLSEALHEIKASGKPIYSAAYIMPCPRNFGYSAKHENHIHLLRMMIDEKADEKIQDAGSMEAAYKVLLAYPSIGPFLAYQYLIDLNYSAQLDFSEQEFVVAGPGAKDGLHLSFSDSQDLSESDLIKWTMEQQDRAFEEGLIDFQDLWSRPLQLIDCQNLYCEIGKYVRAAMPGVKIRSGRKKIKQLYRAKSSKVTAWYPPKWGINAKVMSWRRLHN